MNDIRNNVAIVSLGEIANGNWSAEFHVNKRKGLHPYIKKGGVLVKVDVRKSIPADAIYLTEAKANEANALLLEISAKQKQLEKISAKLKTPDKKRIESFGGWAGRYIPTGLL